MTERDCVKNWFSRRRLGLFLHFGLYSIEGWHEQDQWRRRIPRAKYEKQIALFNPVRFDPDAILDMAENAGMEYVCLTTKHHDGFCLWDTKQTDYNVMNSPYGRDIVGQLAEACHRRRFPLGLYYSVADWHHPNYPNQDRHHELAKPEEGDQPDWDKYMEFLVAQVRELCTNYGEVRHFFWDINVPEHKDPSINAMLRELQPNIVINNRGFDEGDFGTPEREYGHDMEKGASGFTRPAEACNSVGTQSWGFRKDEDYYSAAFLIQSIDKMMCAGANYLLNVGPDGRGNIPEAASGIVSEIGRWYAKVREAFSDTQPCSNLTKNKAILLTRRGNNIYVHLQNPVVADAVVLPGLNGLPSKAVLLNTGERLECAREILPSFWKSGAPVLRIRNLSRELISRGETLIIKLEFNEDVTSGTTKITEFKG